MEKRDQIITKSVWLSPDVTMTTINTTPAEDVLVNGCVSNFNTIACIRSSTLTLLALLTAVLCVLKVFKLHHAHHQNWHQYFIFYCASLECSIAGVHWVLSLYVQFDFVLQWLKLSQFLVMCHFYWTLATRALRREVWTKRFLIPFLVVACFYFTTVAILGIVNVKDTFVECFQPYWIMMSSAEFIIVQLFCVAGFYITRRLNEISTLDSVRRAQKRDLWCIVIVFEISALVGVLYDMTLRIVVDENTGCSAIFKHGQEIFSVIYFIFMIIKLLLPVWVMLFVFQPTPQVSVETDDLIPALTDDMNSAFSTNIDEQYRQLYHPGENYQTLAYDSPTAHSPASGFTSYSPSSPQGSINTMVIGVTNTIYKSAQPNNLGPIGEVDVRQQSPNTHNASVIKRNNTPDAGATADKIVNVSKSVSKQSANGSVKVKPISDAASEKQEQRSESQSKNLHWNEEGNQSQNNQPITTANEPMKVEPVIDSQVAAINRTAAKTKEEGPKFSINDNSDESDDTESPPKGKFYI